MKINPIIFLYILISLCHAQFLIDEVHSLTNEQSTAFARPLEVLNEDELWLGPGRVMYGSFSSPQHLEAIVGVGNKVHGVSTSVLVRWEKSSWRPVYISGEPVASGGYLSDPFFPGGCRKFSTIDERDIPFCGLYDWGVFYTIDSSRAFHETIIIWYSDFLTGKGENIFVLRNSLDGSFKCLPSGLVYHDLHSIYPRDLDADGDDDLVVELLRYTFTQQEPCSSDTYPVIEAFPFITELQTLAWLQDESQFISTEETKLFLQAYDEEIF